MVATQRMKRNRYFFCIRSSSSIPFSIELPLWKDYGDSKSPSSHFRSFYYLKTFLLKPYNTSTIRKYPTVHTHNSFGLFSSNILKGIITMNTGIRILSNSFYILFPLKPSSIELALNKQWSEKYS